MHGCIKQEPNVNTNVVVFVFVVGGFRGCILQASTTTGTASEILVENCWEWMSSEAAPKTHKNMFQPVTNLNMLGTPGFGESF